MAERRKVAIMCSANKLAEECVNPSRRFATLLAQNGYDLVWGASDTG